MQITYVPGKPDAIIMLYALSTCPWCRKTKQLLDDLGVAYSYTFVDLLPESEAEEAMNAVKPWNPAFSFPTMVINNKQVVIGFKETEIRRALNL
jgi:glutaredoxin-like protein NrdH